MKKQQLLITNAKGVTDPIIERKIADDNAEVWPLMRPTSQLDPDQSKKFELPPRQYEDEVDEGPFPLMRTIPKGPDPSQTEKNQKVNLQHNEDVEFDGDVFPLLQTKSK